MGWGDATVVTVLGHMSMKNCLTPAPKQPKPNLKLKGEPEPRWLGAEVFAASSQNYIHPF